MQKLINNDDDKRKKKQSLPYDNTRGKYLMCVHAFSDYSIRRVKKQHTGTNVLVFGDATRTRRITCGRMFFTGDTVLSITSSINFRD